MNSREDLQDLKYFLSCIIEKNDETESSNAFALIMSSILYEEVRNALNPEETIAILKDIIRDEGISSAANCIALILSQCISSVSSVYLTSVLNLCKYKNYFTDMQSNVVLTFPVYMKKVLRKYLLNMLKHLFSVFKFMAKYN